MTSGKRGVVLRWRSRACWKHASAPHPYHSTREVEVTRATGEVYHYARALRQGGA
jgi:hypothetical protein